MGFCNEYRDCRECLNRGSLFWVISGVDRNAGCERKDGCMTYQMNNRDAIRLEERLSAIENSLKKLLDK